MKKVISSLAVIIALLFILSACKPTIESVYESVSSTPLPSPAYTDTPTVETTPTPFVPLTPDEIEAKLEAEFDDELDFSDKLIIGDSGTCVFDGMKGKYFADSQTGEFMMFSSSSYSNNPEQLYNEEELKQIAIDELSKYCPDFFEYDYILKSVRFHETIFNFFFTQLSPNGNHTGNSVFAGIAYNGEIHSFSISCTEDPATVDETCAISEEQAIQLAYDALPGEALEAFNADGSEVSFELQDKKSHESSAYLSCFKGRTRWMVEIINVYCKVITPEEKSAEYRIGFSADVDANSGEIGIISYGVISTFFDGRWQ